MNILLVVSGMTPQIITETVYGLAVAPAEGMEKWIPDEIQVLTTKFGANQIRGALLGEHSPLTQLCAEYQLPNIRFDENSLCIFKNAQDIELDDIKSAEDSETVANAICAKVRELTLDDSVELHVSMAGGRKTMGYYAGYAMSLYGRAQDRMSHVLVSDQFEQVQDFFYPTLESHPVRDRQGMFLDAKEAQVWLMDLPFVRLRSSLEKNKALTEKDFSEVVSKINAANSDVSVVLRPADCQLLVQTEKQQFEVKLNPREFAFFHWIADVTQHPDKYAIRRPSVAQKDYLEIIEQMSETFNEYYAPCARSTDEDKFIDIDQKYFDELKSSLRKSLKQQLGIDFLNRLLPNRKNMTLGIDADCISVRKF